jgi:hypothetical protein
MKAFAAVNRADWSQAAADLEAGAAAVSDANAMRELAKYMMLCFFSLVTVVKIIKDADYVYLHLCHPVLSDLEP